MPELLELFRGYRDERAVAVHATTLHTDYAQAEKWLERCPHQAPQDGRKAMTWILQQPGPKARIKVAARLKSVYRWALETGQLEHNPVANYKFPKAPQTEEVVVIPRRETPLLIAGLERYGNVPSYSSVVAFMLQTGMRTGEVFAAQLDDIDGNELVVHQNMTLTHGLKGSTKTNRRRRVPLNAVAKGILEKMTPIAINGFLFPYNRYSFASFFAERVTSMVEQGVLSRRYRPYHCRHTAISFWLESGASIQQVASWAGNSAEVCWKHYAGVTTAFEMPVL